MVFDDPLPSPPAPRPVRDTLLAAILVAGYGAPPLLAFCATMVALGSAVGLGLPSWAIGLLTTAGAFFAMVIVARRVIVRRGRGPFVVAFEVLVLAVLPLWGLVENHLASGDCVTNQCDATPFFRPFAEPEVFGVLAGHVLASLAYLVSRRRRERLPPAVEIFVGAALLFGCGLEALVALQLGPWILGGIAVPPLLLPAISPVLAIALFGAELGARLGRRGRELEEAEARESERRAEASLDYRAAPIAVEPPGSRWARGLGGAIAGSPILVGLYAVVHAAWLGRADGALEAFTRTCDHTLSRLPIVVLPADCHYLCTVAARGHASLVRPRRLGRRGGVTIVVNRQLALANAFEDLLHERWPRFGRLARATYDRCGLPLSRLIQSRWASDLVYLAMKPAEWTFYFVLLVLDRAPPEERIDRMYR